MALITHGCRIVFLYDEQRTRVFPSTTLETVIHGRSEVLRLEALETEVSWDVKLGKWLLMFRKIEEPSSPETVLAPV